MTRDRDKGSPAGVAVPKQAKHRAPTDDLSILQGHRLRAVIVLFRLVVDTLSDRRLRVCEPYTGQG